MSNEQDAIRNLPTTAEVRALDAERTHSWLGWMGTSILRVGCCLTAVSLLGIVPVTGAGLTAPNNLGLRVTRGFEVRLFADSGLADDIYALTINPRGQVVVSGRGYIRTLIDANDDGVAESAVDFGETFTGGMGLCFDGPDLLFVGDGGLWRVRDANGDNRADSPAERLLEIPFAEHGGHAIRRGPEGALYLMVGNEGGLGGYFGPTGPAAGLRAEGGALLYQPIRGDGSFRVRAHGFRNPYDFDFNAEGDLFTWDSDAEADFLLPWYTPTRLFHIAPGGHHGWRLDGWKRSWARPDYSPDTVEILARLGRGSPTGMLCYRHYQFPEFYRNGIFALDWTFGRVHFAPLVPDGASYTSTPEVFLESSGSTGFAPTDIAVAPAGGLYVSTGGRRTRGAVYRIDYVDDPARWDLATNWMYLTISDVMAVLDAPQPLDEWSRRIWMGVVQARGASSFVLAATDGRISVERRARAIEILTQFEGGLAANVATSLARSDIAEIRSRTAWSLGVYPGENAARLLGVLAEDNAAFVRCAALQALTDQAAEMPPSQLQQAVAANLDHIDRRVRQAAALLATWLPESNWNSLLAQRPGLPAGSRLTLILAHFGRTPPTGVDSRAIDWALDALSGVGATEGQVEAVRFIQRALGDYNLAQPSAEVFTGYEPAQVPNPTLAARIERAISPLFPSRSPELNIEVTRTLAMIQAGNAALIPRVVAAIGPSTEPASDFHYLATLARLGARLPTNQVDAVALAIVALDRKHQDLTSRSKQNWGARLGELVQRLLERNPSLGAAIVRQPELVRSGNLPLVSLLGATRRLACARLFRDAVQRTTGYQWSAELVDLLSTLPADTMHPLFRRQWSNPMLRDRLILQLGTEPRLEERAHFTAGLDSSDARVVQAAAEALNKLPHDPSPLVPALRALRRFILKPDDREVRTRLLALISRVTGQKFTARNDTPDLAAAHQHVFSWVGQHYPGSLSQVDADDRESQAKWDQMLKSVSWNRGDAGRGAAIFQQRGCVECHEGTSALGPDLAGVTARLSTNDLFNAILYPSREISPAWRMERFRLRSGEVFSGRVTFESGETLLVQTGVSQTVRLDASQVTIREPSEVSFMPGGLLGGLTPTDLADLYAWLKQTR